MTNELDVKMDGQRLVIIEDDQEQAHVREIPLEAVASFAELLGYSCPWETIEAILHIQDHGEPDHDPVTGENAWTDGYKLLAYREKARDEAYLQAEEEGTENDPRSPLLRSSFAAYNAVHKRGSANDSCVMDRCRSVARERLGLNPPTRNAGMGARLVDTGFKTRQVTAKTERQALIEDAISPHLDDVTRLRERFLSELSPVRRNPFAPPEPEPDEWVDPIQATLQKYGGDLNA